jgi:hypothetical protein
MTDRSRFVWYARRLGRMSPREVAWRVREQALRRAWTRRQVLPGRLPAGPVPGALPLSERRFTGELPPDAASLVPAAAREAIIADADRILKGEWVMLSVARGDMLAPDWFFDPATGLRSDPAQYAFAINQRAEERVGNIKQVWELNRLQHLTLLAAAWYLTDSDKYARCVADQLASWWESNPFLSGVNWTSGIELGVRLINFAWIRRLMSGWPGIEDLFEHNELAVRQLRWHQEYLASFESRGSSANNHVIAEAAGSLTASCAFPWFTQSARWRVRALALLERSLRSNTFPSGINRELASDYHGFVFELGAFAATEASVFGSPVSDETWRLLCRMADCMAGLVDEQCQPPRQGDSDEGRVVLLDHPEHNRWPALLAVGSALFGRLDWWPSAGPDAGSALVRALAGAPREVAGRPSTRPFRFADAGITILRTSDSHAGPRAGSAESRPGVSESETGSSEPEIWCRCDGGPHGFLSIAAHAHADALSVEVRHAGTDILADPGTYCYHGEPEWRSYFRSTIAHNTVEVGARSQAIEAGPFMWRKSVRSWEVDVSEPGLNWTAEHDGYASLRPRAGHHRSVQLDPVSRRIDITDVIDGGDHEVRMAFHLGPLVNVSLERAAADLSWPDSAVPGAALLELPAGFEWCLHRGETSPILGWYSAGLGHRVPAFTIVGTGRARRDQPLFTRLRFLSAEAK